MRHVYVEHTESMPERSEDGREIKDSENHCGETGVWTQDRDRYRGDGSTYSRQRGTGVARFERRVEPHA